MVSQEYEDISREAVIMICNWDHNIANILASRAAHDPYTTGSIIDNYLLWQLGGVVSTGRCLALKLALEKHIGKDWIHFYNVSKNQFSDSLPD